ncbi:hypothetical protein WDM22_00715 [Bradyrhizobium septentrionale]
MKKHGTRVIHFARVQEESEPALRETECLSVYCSIGPVIAKTLQLADHLFKILASVQLAPVRDVLKENMVESSALKKSQCVPDEHRLGTRKALSATCLAEIRAGKTCREQI